MNRLCLNVDIPHLSYEEFKKIYKATRNYVQAYKINPAFCQDQNVIEKIQIAAHSGCDIILDSKFGDILSTNLRYHNYVKELQVQGVTLNPFVGLKSLTPFVEKDYTPYILLTSTNGEQEEWQEMISNNIISFAKQTKAGIICPDHKIDFVKQQYPDAKILCPGIGHQGGKINSRHDNITYCVGRSVFAFKNNELDYEELTDRIKEYSDKIARQNLILSMKKSGCFYERDIKLSNGQNSNVYFDFRKAWAKDTLMRDFIHEELVLYVRKNKIKNIVAIAAGGIPAASTLAYMLKLNFAYIRNNPKKHGTEQQIEGYIDPSLKTMLFDDVVTTGNSINNALRTLTQNHCFTQYVETFCILDRSEAKIYNSIFKY
tara:strand:+ start:867 stop:1985 length:1119 start_codon:yes stop_codon:yes gene_type:complete